MISLDEAHHMRDVLENVRGLASEIFLVDSYSEDGFGIEHVHFVKCDTEGHDASVIRGAVDLLRATWVAVFQFEYNHHWVFSRSFLKDVFELIEGAAYSLVCVYPAELTLLEIWHLELDRFFQSNYALVHERALARAPLCRNR